MKRAIGGAGRRGTPPLPRQRRALRVTQSTLLAVAAWCIYLGIGSDGIDDRIGLFLLAAALGGVGLWMGIRTVRGPEPPHLD